MSPPVQSDVSFTDRLNDQFSPSVHGPAFRVVRPVVVRIGGDRVVFPTSDGFETTRVYAFIDQVHPYCCGTLF